MEKNFSKCEEFQIFFLPAMFGIEFAVALVGNVFALWLLLTKERRNWHSGVVLSCNLIISDLLYIITLPLLIVYYSRGKNWLYGETLCKIEKFLFMCNLNVSIFFVMAISVNRCVALVWPFFSRSYVEPAHVKVISVIIWITVGVVSSPMLKFASISHKNNKTLCESFCFECYTDLEPFFAYKLFLAVFGCLIPFLVTFTSYCMVIRVVWQNTSITILEKRKVALLVTSVIILYAVSYIPFHFFQNYHLYKMYEKYNLNTTNCVVYYMYQASKGLATLNMCIHPVLYVAVFDSIRVACCGKSPEDNVERRAMRK